MKTITSLFLLTLLSACGSAPVVQASKSLTFSEKKNCSSKSIEMISKRDEAREKKITLYEHNLLQTRTVDFYLSKEQDLLSCPTSQESYVCVAISINNKSKIDFVEASDEVNKIEPELKACIEKKLQAYNYKELKAKFGTKFIMPLKFIRK